MVGLVDSLTTSLSRVSNNPVAVICLLLMVLLIYAKYDPSNNPFTQFIELLNESITANPGSTLAKFAKVVKQVVYWISSKSRLSMCSLSSTYVLGPNPDIVEVVISCSMFVVVYFSKLSLLSILGMAQLGFLFFNSDLTTIKIAVLMVTLCWFILGVDKVLALIS